MKWLFLLSSIFLSATVIAQKNENKLLQKLERGEELRTGERGYVAPTPFVQKAQLEKVGVKFHMPVPSNAIIVAPLPQDNMPCVVPNMKYHRTMPTVGDSTILKHPIDPGIYAYKKKKQQESIINK
jgi:hypothetical protein